MGTLFLIAIILTVLLVFFYIVIGVNADMQSGRGNGPSRPVDWKNSQENVLARIIENLRVLDIYDLEIHQRSDLVSHWSVIRKQYLKLALQNHPDKNKGDKDKEEKFKAITAAFAELQAIYDEDTYTGIDDLSAALRFFNAHMEGHC